MKVCGVYIEKIENKGRALWVLGVFAREKEGTMLAHACVRARRRWRRRRRRRRRVRARVWVWVWVPLPGLILFESGLKGMGRTKPNPVQIQTARPPIVVCKRLRTARQRMSENRLCGWAVWTEQLRRFCPNRCNCWDLADVNAPPGAL